MKAYEIFKRSTMSLIIHGAMIGCGLVMVGSALTPTTASARSSRDFYFTNSTGTTITGLYVAPHGAITPWSENCLSSPLSPGETRFISWDTEPGMSNWDVLLTYSTGVEARFCGGVNLPGRLVVSLLESGTVSHLEVYKI